MHGVYIKKGENEKNCVIFIGFMYVTVLKKIKRLVFKKRKRDVE
jgi:hypothetical protein